MFSKIKGYGDATNPSPYYLAQDIQGNIFQSFPLLQIYDSKKSKQKQ